MKGHSMDYAREFALDSGITYLDHAAVAPWPRRTMDAVKQFAEENATQGSLEYRRWLGMEARLREQLRTLLNAQSVDDIALVKNTSEGLSFVAYGLEWREGDNIVSAAGEFPSNRVVWESLASRGVELRCADLSHSDDPERSLLERMDEKTRLLAVSSVQYASGLALDLPRLGTACRDRGILFCVDAIQSLGALVADVQRWHADFVIADGHKWMLGPEGLGVFYCRAEMRERLQLHEYGWHMLENAGDYDRLEWRPARSARRFECGSPNTLGAYALSASLSLLLEIGVEEVEKRVRANANLLMEFAAANSTRYRLLTPRGRHAGIVTVAVTERDTNSLVDALRTRGIACAHRGGGIRFSPHFYHSRAELEHAWETLEELAR